MKLRKKFRLSLYSILSLAFLSGALWFSFDRFVRVAGPLGEDHHPLQAWFLRIHGVMIYGVLLSLGYMIHAHIRPGLKGKRGRRTGIPMLLFFAAMIVTALIQLYWTDSPFRDNTALVHTYMGLSLPLFFIGHVISARLMVQRARSAEE